MGTPEHHHHLGNHMSLLINECTVATAGDLVLSSGSLEIRCQITVEWLRGIAEPTWYGYFVPVSDDIRVLPGRYRLTLADTTFEILVRRPAPLGEELCFPFWGLGRPPAALDSDAAHDA